MLTNSAVHGRRTTYREVLAEPQFRLLFLTRSVAIMADSLRITTFAVLVFAATGSPLLSAVSFGIGFLPQMFGTLLLGSLADRLPPRSLIAGGYLMESAVAVALTLLPLPVPVSLALVALVALCTPLFHGASGRLVARSLRGDAYVLGRSLNNLASSGAQLLGLALGGAAVATIGVRPTLATGAVLYLAVATAVRLGLPDLTVDSQPPGHLMRTSLQSVRAIVNLASTRRLLLAQWLPPACVAGVSGLLIAYAGQRQFAPGTYALLLACLPIGMLLGDLLVGRLLRPRSREVLVAPLIAVMGLPLLAFAANPGALISGVILLIAGTGFAYELGLQRAFLGSLSEGTQGQAFGLLHSGTMTLQGVGSACFGAVSAATGTVVAMATAGVATLLSACWIASWHRAGTHTS